MGRKIIRIALSAILLTVAFFALGIGASAEIDELLIADRSGSDYVIIRGTDSSDAATAYALSEKIYVVTRSDVFDYATTRKESEKEILLGRTNRQLSLDLIAEIEAKYPSDSYAWGFAVRGEQLAIYANSAIALDFCLEELYSEYLKDGRFAVPSDLFDIKGMTAEEYEEYLAELERIEAEEREKRRRERLEFLKGAISSEFKNSDFGEYVSNMTEVSGVTYDPTPIYPEIGEHPRVLVNAEMIASIIEQMKETDTLAEKTFWQRADSEIANDAKLPPASSSGIRGFNNFDLGILGVIQAKAFAYLISGDELYAYEAVYAMKNYLKTLDVQYITSDGTREFGYCMYIAACVYDWCYDILSEDDKFQITAGVEHILCRGTMAQPDKGSYGGVKMEMGFPPTAQGAVCGHGSERALMRDYLSMAIAIYDEEPSWWDFCAGRYYKDYVPVRELFYDSGMIPQGMSEYASGRYMSDLYSAMLIKAVSGDIPFDNDMRDVVITMASYETYSNNIFSAGDHRLDKDTFATQMGYCAMMSAYLFEDPVALDIAVRCGHGYTVFYGGTFNLSPVEALVCLQNKIDPISLKYDEMNTIVYNGGIFGQIIARNKWNSLSAVAVLMKIGVRHTANHDHYASGSFQIYYKGMLTSDTGVYDSYGTTHHTKFHKATVSHNSLLIYNPALADTYYVGGQRDGFTEPKTYDAWMRENYKTGEVLGYSYGYDQQGNSKYSYISGDISSAYNPETVDFVGRTMLSVFTGDEYFPMVFFVFDRIDAISPDFKKTFLLQITSPDAPVVEGNTVTTVNGDGKLVLQSLIGADSITAIGGKGQNYLVNGTQLTSNNDDNTWGRVEISPNTGNNSDVMLNVMYVTDKNEKQTLTSALLDVSTGNASAAKIASTVAVFANGNIPETSPISFTNEGDGIFEYYVGNLASGTWIVKLNGEKLGSVYAANDAKMVTFKAPAGEITVEPAADVNAIPESKIKYVANNGILPEDAPLKYQHGTATALPTDVTRGTDIFLGWYTDPAFANKITEIPETATGLFTVYAKWGKIYVNEDYDTFSIDKTDITSSSSIGQGIALNGGQSALNTVKTDNEKGTLTWTVSGKGPGVSISNVNYPFSKLTDSSVSYEITLANLADVKNMNLNIRVRDKDNNAISIATLSGVNVTVGGVTVATLSETETTVRLVLDFASAKVYAYDEDGNVITANSFTVPEGYASALAWQSAFQKEVLNMYASSGGTLVIGKIFIAESNLFSDGTPPSDDYVVYPDGVGLPDGYIKNYTSGIAAKLPETAFKDGFAFDGWYADETLTARITEIPASASGPFSVYAKWNRVYVNESWDSLEIDLEDVLKAASVGSGLALNNGNSQLNDVKSDKEKGTLTWTVDGKGPAIVAKNKNNPIKTLAEDCYTIEISMAKLSDLGVPRLTFRVRDDADGTKKTITIAELSGGVLKVGGTEILTLTEELQTARLVIDFGDAKVYAFDGYGNGIASADITAPEGYESVAQWQGAFVNELLNIYAGGGGTIVFGHVYIAEGNLYGDYKYVDPNGNKIIYPTDVTLPEDAPVSYPTGEETPLPTTASKSGSYFLGWYSDEALTNHITHVPADAVGEFKVYAKWTYAYVNESYDTYQINETGITSKASVGTSLGLNSGEGSLNNLNSDNEKGVLIWTTTGQGPALVVNNTANSMSKQQSGIFTFEFSFEYVEGIEMLNLHMRTRDANKNEISLVRVTDGVVSFGEVDLYTVKPDEQITMRFVVDFKNATVYFYDSELNVYRTREFSHPSNFESAEAWQANFTKEVVNIRAEGGGTVLVHHLLVTEGNIYAQ